MKNPRISDLRFAVLATDVVIFGIKDKRLFVYIIPINIPKYFKDVGGLPGGIISIDETAEESIYRHIENKTDIDVDHIEQLKTFSEIKRDPRNRVVSVAYLGCVKKIDELKKEKGEWVSINEVPKLAFDHGEIVKSAIERLRSKISYTTIIQFLLPTEFTMTELQSAYEIILKTKLDRRNFQKKIKELKIIKSIGKYKKGLPNRPALLFKFISNRIENIEVFL